MTSSDITFGPPGQEWTYSKSTKTYDLSQKSSNTLKIRTSEGAEGTYITIAPGKTALVIVDMQNFFLDAQCMDHPNGLKAVEPTITAIEACRKAGIQIIWLNWGLTDTDFQTLPAGVQRGFLKDIINSATNPIRSYTGLGSDLGGTKGRCLFAGSWNAAIYTPLLPHCSSSDIHCPKNRMSGVWNEEQPLYKTLKEKGIETVLFGGVNTDQCVLGTFVDAYNKGWNCVLVDDCCGTTTVGGKETTLGNVSKNYGFVVDSNGIKEAVEGNV